MTDMITTVLRSFCNSTCLFFSASHFLILKGLYSLLVIHLVICHNRCCNNTWILCLYNGELHNWTLLLVRPVVQIFTFSATKMHTFYVRNIFLCVIKMYLRRSSQHLCIINSTLGNKTVIYNFQATVTESPKTNSLTIM